MNIEQFREHCLSKKEVTEGFPFPNLPQVLVFKVAGKMFAATDVTTFASISIRCYPNTIDELRATYPAVQKPSYFSARHWTKVVIDRTITDDLILQWIDDSYTLALANLTKKVRTELSLS